MSSGLIVALDYADANAALDLVERLDPRQCRLKIGKELFTREGPALVREVQQRGFELFLDLKFHDIPATVAGAVRAAAELDVWMVNVHASGGRAMMSAAREALDDYPDPPLLIAVTVLTSMDGTALREVGVERSLENQVLGLAGLAHQCGMDGVVCSAREARSLKAALGCDFQLVTPGVRPRDAASDDQSRVVTPREAQDAGSDFLVVGRPVTRADDPAAAVRAILAELA